MNPIYIIVAESGSGSEFRYSPRFYFTGATAQADAEHLSKRLNQAATTVYSLTLLPQERRDPATHDTLVAIALGVLQELDPGATAVTHYRVLSATSYTEPTLGAPANPAQDVFRRVRELGA